MISLPTGLLPSLCGAKSQQSKAVQRSVVPSLNVIIRAGLLGEGIFLSYLVAERSHSVQAALGMS